MSNKVRVNPKDPKYQGCYQHTTQEGLVIYWVKKNVDGKMWHKVGYANDGITPAYVKNFRGALTTENIHHIVPTKHRRIDEQGEEVVIPTVDEAWNEFYLPWMERGNVTKGTMNGVISKYTNHIKPHIGTTRLCDLTVLKLDKLKGKWEKAGIQEQTMSVVWATLSGLIKRLSQLGIYDATAALNIPKKINAKVERTRILDEDQLDELLDAIKAEDYATWQQCMIMTFAGLRSGEVVKLTPANVRLDKGVIQMIGIKSSRKKNKQASVEIDDELIPIFEELVSGKPKFSGELLFPKSFKYAVWHAACNQLGLNDGIKSTNVADRLTPHCLRHSFATNLLASGVDIKTVQVMMRHDDLASTMRYVHLVPGSRQNALKLRAKRRKRILADKHRENIRVIEGGVE